MNDEHKRSTPGERALPLAEVLERVGDAFRAGIGRVRRRLCGGRVPARRARGEGRGIPAGRHRGLTVPSDGPS